LPAWVACAHGTRPAGRRSSTEPLRRTSAQSVAKKPNRLVPDLDAAIVPQVLDLPRREGETDRPHYRQADDLGAGLALPWGCIS
jgi:hypothetical protein